MSKFVFAACTWSERILIQFRTWYSIFRRFWFLTRDYYFSVSWSHPRPLLPLPEYWSIRLSRRSTIHLPWRRVEATRTFWAGLFSNRGFCDARFDLPCVAPLVWALPLNLTVIIYRSVSRWYYWNVFWPSRHFNSWFDGQCQENTASQLRLETWSDLCQRHWSDR